MGDSCLLAAIGGAAACRRRLRLRCRCRRADLAGGRLRVSGFRLRACGFACWATPSQAALRR